MRSGELVRSAGLAVLLWGSLGAGCAASRPPELPDPDVDLGLGDIVLLTFTTRASEGLLGHAADVVPAPGVDPLRRAIRGQPHVVGNDQHLRVVIRVADRGELGAGYGPVAGSVQAAHATHIAYDVRLTGYLEYAPADLLYDAESGCCLGGGVSESCGGFYVSRLFRGTGSTQLLSEATAEASVEAGEIVHASGGKLFRRLSESSFIDSYFAYEVSPLAPLCERLPPESEFADMKVESARNCFLTRFDAAGQRTRDAWSLPDRELCAEVAARRCSEAGPALRCEATYFMQTADASEAIPLELVQSTASAGPPAALVATPAATAAGARPAAAAAAAPER